MLKWNKDLYVGSGVRDPLSIRHKIEQNKPVPGVYLLTYPTNESNIMDILPAINLLQKKQRELCPEIIGIAKGKDEAIELFQEIVQKVYKETGDFNIEEYWRNR